MSFVISKMALWTWSSSGSACRAHTGDCSPEIEPVAVLLAFLDVDRALSRSDCLSALGLCNNRQYIARHVSQGISLSKDIFKKGENLTLIHMQIEVLLIATKEVTRQATRNIQLLVSSDYSSCLERQSYMLPSNIFYMFVDNMLFRHELK